MAKGRLRLYRLDPEYVHELSLHDKRVMSIEPNENKDKRPFVGIVIPHGRRWYCIPLSSPKPKHATMKADRDFSKKAYKNLMQDQLRWCNDNRELIQRKAAKLYSIVAKKPSSARGLVRRCCDFPALEKLLDSWHKV